MITIQPSEGMAAHLPSKDHYQLYTCQPEEADFQFPD